MLILCILKAKKLPKAEEDAITLANNAIATVIHACCTIAHSALDMHSPGQVAFHQDIYLDLPFMANLIMLQKK